MSVSSGDLHDAVGTLWTDAGLDDIFTALGGSVPSLNETEAREHADFPYCVIEEGLYEVVTRSSGEGCTIREIRDIPWTFHVHAKEVDGDDRNAKQIAAYLASEIMKVFGGHPEDSPTKPTLTYGNFLISQMLRDYPVREDDSNYMWVIDYNFRIDVPVTI